MKKQERWLNETLPKIEQEVITVNGVLLYEDEAVFQQSGTITRTWARVGVGAEVKSEPCHRSAKAFGAVNVTEASKPKWHFRFAEVFNAVTFLMFLRQLLRAYPRQKVFLIMDNARYHHAKVLQPWLQANAGRIQLHFLPPYSPDLNPVEDVWRVSKRKGTHNVHFPKLADLRAKLLRTFNRFQGNPAALRNTVQRFACRN